MWKCILFLSICLLWLSKQRRGHSLAVPHPQAMGEGRAGRTTLEGVFIGTVLIPLTVIYGSYPGEGALAADAGVIGPLCFALLFRGVRLSRRLWSRGSPRCCPAPAAPALLIRVLTVLALTMLAPSLLFL